MARLRRELEEARSQLGLVRGRLAQSAADELAAAAQAAGETRVIGSFDAVDAAFLRVVAKRIVTAPRLVALLSARMPETQLVLAARGAASDFDCGAFVKRLAAAHGGRGGGRPEMAEGRLPPDADFVALARAG